jgi:hypothetical protein
MAYMRLHKNPEGEVRKVRLTVEAEGDDIDGKIGIEVEEGAPRLTP